MEAQTPSHNKAADHGIHYACDNNSCGLLDGGGCNVRGDYGAGRDCIDIQRIKECASVGADDVRADQYIRCDDGKI